MTKTNVFKKSVSLALAFTMLLSLFCIMSKTNVGAVQTVQKSSKLL